MSSQIFCRSALRRACILVSLMLLNPRPSQEVAVFILCTHVWQVVDAYALVLMCILSYSNSN